MPPAGSPIFPLFDPAFTPAGGGARLGERLILPTFAPGGGGVGGGDGGKGDGDGDPMGGKPEHGPLVPPGVPVVFHPGQVLAQPQQVNIGMATYEFGVQSRPMQRAARTLPSTSPPQGAPIPMGQLPGGLTGQFVMMPGEKPASTNRTELDLGGILAEDEPPSDDDSLDDDPYEQGFSPKPVPKRPPTVPEPRKPSTVPLPAPPPTPTAPSGPPITKSNPPCDPTKTWIFTRTSQDYYEICSEDFDLRMMSGPWGIPYLKLHWKCPAWIQILLGREVAAVAASECDILACTVGSCTRVSSSLTATPEEINVLNLTNSPPIPPVKRPGGCSGASLGYVQVKYEMEMTCDCR